MSSTNRSDARNTHISDYYITPIDDIVLFLNELNKIEPGCIKGRILDPCSGGDNEHPMSYPEALKSLGAEDITTIDIRENSLAANIQDYLATDVGKGKFDVIITNPPFNISLEIIKKALEDVKDNGYVIMLLRLNYLGGKLRKEFWNGNMPKYIFVHHKRMSFTDDKKTDSIEYMHTVWQKGYEGPTQLFIV